jgi:hypothetical protein
MMTRAKTSKSRPSKWRRVQGMLLVLLSLSFSHVESSSSSSSPSSSSWEWRDYLDVGGDFYDATFPSQTSTLSIDEVSKLKVREIKRRLALTHGFSAEELGRILDKKELIEALAFEEEKIRLGEEAEVKRFLLKRGIIVALISVVVVMCWPLFQHAFEIAQVNVVVYTDRKRHEASRCIELQSYKAMIGVFLMLVMDLLGMWMTASLMLSFVMKSNKYFFPYPNFPIRPAQLMGGGMAQAFGGYGLNIAPMIIRWLMRFVNVKLEVWTGRCMSLAHKAQRQAAREFETEQERTQRKVARKLAKQQEKAEAAERAAAAFNHQQQQRGSPAPPADMPPNWMQPTAERIKATAEQQPTSSNAHEEFLNQLELDESELVELD